MDRGSFMNKIAIVGGCGHVGFPLGLALASRDFDVILIDINRDAVELVNSGVVPFKEEGAAELLRDHIGKNLRAVTGRSAVSAAEAVIFVTGTPVDEHLVPKIRGVVHSIQEYLPLMNEKQLIVLRSTLFPGTVQVIRNILERNGWKPKLAFCPERILQGKGIAEIFQLPQIISGVNKESEEAVASIFSRIAPKLIRVRTEEAELAKLMTNSWRYLEFAIANQFYMMAAEYGIDFYNVYRALKEDYPRAKSFASPGLAAGPCLFKDTMQLASFYNNKFFLGHAAMLVNEGLPNHLVADLKKKMGGSLRNRAVAILGMTFKANNDDTRESLSYKIKKLLEVEMAEVIESDPYLPETCSCAEALNRADGVILGVPHDEYLALSVRKPFVDCWGVWLNRENESTTGEQ